MSTLRIHAVPLVAGLLGLAAVWFVGRDANPGPIGFRLDDAWIHMVYGRGLAESGLLAYEDGVPSTGCTSPLWAAVLAAIHALAGNGPPETIVGMVILAGAILHLAGVVAATGLARRLDGGAGTAMAAGLLVAIAPPLAAAGLSGMEIALTGTLLLAGAWALAGGRALVSGVLFALAGLARPESAACIAVAALFVIGSGPRERRIPRLVRCLLPPAISAAAFVGYNLWASGRPLPATFYLKSALSASELPERIAVAATQIFARVPPFGAGIGWLAIAGLAARGLAVRGGGAPIGAAAVGAGASCALPLALGAAFALANLLVLEPVDPGAFYHQRYLWPAAPLLLVAAALGASALRLRFPRLREWPRTVLVAVAAIQAAATVESTSRHLHNDVRNINEVQRALGERLRATLPAGTRIASSDAGAVRYFSRLPTLDVVGLNTPGMLAPNEEFTRTHPVAALVFLPAWFRTPDGARLTELFRAQTAGYTVTSNAGMALQVVVAARPDGGAAPVRARFVGFRAFELDFVPPPSTFRGGP